MITCSRCVLDSRIPNITFDSKGFCNYCRLHDKWERDHSYRVWKPILKDIKNSGRNKRYDCVVGISGGCDSSYLLYNTKEVFGLRPLAVHWDNNWNTNIAKENIRKMIDGLGVDFCRIGVDRKEYDDICRSFLLASVVDADIPNDIALTTVLYYIAEKFGVKYIFNGHNFRTEGTTPLGWSYMDGKYVESVQKTFGTCKLKTFPNLWLEDWLVWLNDGIKRIRPLWYVHYKKEDAKRLLNEKFGWEWYGGHHLENKYTIFVSNFLQPLKFRIDLRLIEFSALIRSGQMDRDYALQMLEEPPRIDEEIIEEVKKRLQISDDELDQILKDPIKTHNDYETYQKTFKKYRNRFQKAVEENLIPKTFFEKYMR